MRLLVFYIIFLIREYKVVASGDKINIYLISMTKLLFNLNIKRNMIVQPDEINEQATIETLSSFLKSSPITYIGRLSIQQIDLLLYILPQAYIAPLNGNERSKAVMEQVLNIRRRQLVERQKEGRASKDKKPISSDWWQLTFLNWLRLPRASNQSVYQSPKMEQLKLQGHKIGTQHSNEQNSSLSPLLPYSDIGSTSGEKEKKNK